MTYKLKTAIEYWVENKKLYGEDKVIWYDRIIKFLKQPLQLWMFIPCDKEGKPLEKPELIYEPTPDDLRNFEQRELEYQQACDRVLFEGFEIVEHSKGYFYIENDVHVVAQKNYGCEWVFVGYNIIEDLSGKVDLVEKVAEQFKY